MADIKLIALDLDGTLLNSSKELTPACASALRRAADAGIEIVPTTGRFYGGMPECIRSLAFVRYAITMNGAQVYDARQDRALAKTELPWRQAVEIMAYLDTLPVIYDCFMDNWGWMTASLQARTGEFAPDAYYADMLRRLRTPVPELKAFLTERQRDVQKVQLFTRDMELRARLLRELDDMFPGTAATSSVVNNVEINHIRANKGEALQTLARKLGIPMEQTMAFGDGGNDLSMLRDAGVGVAMANACPEAKAAADQLTADCDHDGVAAGILKICFGEA